jgi:hypothetical protein
MKKFTKTLLILIIEGCVFSSQANADPETNIVYLKVSQASNDVSQIIQTMPEIETLWPQQSRDYIRTLDLALGQTAGALGGLSKDTNAKKAFLGLFASMMQKSSPTNESDAAQWIHQKSETILSYLNFNEIGNDKTQLVAIAKFVGEIRSKRIPDYVNQGVMLSVSMPDHPEIIKQMIDDNERKKVTDNYQSELWQADRKLVMILSNYCFRFSSGNPTNADFIKQVSNAAQLTTEERNQFFGKH